MRLRPEHHDTLAAAIGRREWVKALTSMERATLVIEHAPRAGIDVGQVTPAQLSVLMAVMPLDEREMPNYADMACALAMVLPKVQSINEEALAALTNLLAALDEERQIFVDCSSVNGVVDDLDDKEVLAKFDAVIQPARAVIAKVRP